MTHWEGDPEEDAHGVWALVGFILIALALALGPKPARPAELERPLNIETRAAYPIVTPAPALRLYGMVCATGPFEGWTARHVVDGGGDPFAWLYGPATTLARTTVRYGKVDVVRALSESPFPHYSPVAAAAPRLGDRLWFLDRIEEGRHVLISGQVSGFDDDDQLIAQGGSNPGSSGGCVWNDAGEVIGIHVAYGRSGNIQFTAAEPIWRGWKGVK